MNSGSCSRPACSGLPAAWLAYDYSARCAWIDDPIDETVGGPVDRSTRWPLCERHADSLRVPKGWSRVDRRAAALEDATVEGASYFKAGRLGGQKPGAGGADARSRTGSSSPGPDDDMSDDDGFFRMSRVCS